MGFINIFKIERDRFDDFIKRLHDLCGDPHGKDCTIDGTNFHADLYVKRNRVPQKLSWRWVLREFDTDVFEKEKQAWSVMVAVVGGTHYALTFGNAFYQVDKFSDKDFAFAIGRKFDYKQIKSTAQANPDSNRNKTIVSYLKNEKFEYASGESYIKIKGCIKLGEDFSLFKENIEIGSSIKLDTESPTLDKCLRILLYLNELAQKEDITRIPIFVKVKDESLKAELDQRLADDFKQGHFTISFADFDIIGTQESFYSAPQGYTIKYNHKRMDVDAINENSLREFCSVKNLEYDEVALLLCISVREGDYDSKYSVKELIDYTNEEKKCVLLKGEWYQYNDDYLAELDASMDEFDVLEDEKFNWTDEKYEAVLARKFSEEKDEDQYQGLSEAEIKSSLKRKYYSERAYNIYMSDNYGYELLDRQGLPIGDSTLEPADLYGDGCLIAVKIGDSSSKLCYAVDQIDGSAKLLRKQATFDRAFNKVAVLFVLERKNALPKPNGKPELRRLKMLILKNRLNEWKREMRILGLDPQIFIGYRN